ncbi:MAG: T9SS type A sorting domain-containing protein [Chitinophagales bacterium]|nr:T9SS type A sorting domain-containing protein [Chitinophagales bacterium]
MKKTALLVFLVFSSFKILEAQLFYANDFPVIENNDTLKHPWMGGIDLPQFSNADINNDGLMDLIVFDKKSNAIKVLLLDSTGKYNYAPTLSEVFPKDIYGFAIFKDYNCDGLVDIFSQTNAGIRVHKQQLVNGQISFELVKSILEFDLGGNQVNLYNVNGDVPGIVDIDSDGDIDIVVFPIFGGDVILYRNISQESGYGCDSLIYEEYNSCWGQFRESNTNYNINFDVSCKGGGSNANTGGAKHIGSTILVFDPNADGKYDLLLGDVTFTNLVYLQNDNTNLDAHMNSSAVDYFYPSFNASVNVVEFPAAFEADVDADGLKDLLVSPNTLTSHVNYNSSWFYKNTGNPASRYSFVQKDFLIQDNIDLGGFGYAVFEELSGDTLLDMLVCNGYLFDENGVKHSINKYYKNVGNDTMPVFELVTDNYANLNNLGVFFIRPTFGDIDADGDKDMIVGVEDGTLLFYENTAGMGNAPTFVFNQFNYFGLDVGNRAHPQLIDLNGDTLLDLVVGKEGSYGNIAYYWNFGTATAPVFHQDSSNLALGNIATNEPGFIQGYSAPFVLPTDSNTILYTGTDVGNILSFEVNTDSLKNGSFTLLDSTLLPVKAGLQTNLFITDVDHNNALDYFVGNISGGVLMYTTTPTEDSIPIIEPAIKDLYAFDFVLYPNPSENSITISFNKENKVVFYGVINVLGQVVLSKKEQFEEDITIDISSLNSGIYSVILQNNHSQKSVKSFIKK